MTHDSDSHRRLAGFAWRSLACGLVALILLVSVTMAASAGAVESADSERPLPAESVFLVELDADGSARVTLVTTFDLTTDSEREAFEALRANQTARERRTEVFATRMRSIATRAENNAGRDMAIRNAAMAFTTKNNTGIVALSVTWEGLAAQEGDRLRLREPFASGFTIDRPFRIVTPDGYERITATPTPTTQRQNSATWSANTTFDGFETKFAPSGAGTGTSTNDPTTGAAAPGVGIGVATLAVLGSMALLVVRHRRHSG